MLVSSVSATSQLASADFLQWLQLCGREANGPSSYPFSAQTALHIEQIQDPSVRRIETYYVVRIIKRLITIRINYKDTKSWAVAKSKCLYMERHLVVKSVVK
jgi:hypothetical protein